MSVRYYTHAHMSVQVLNGLGGTHYDTSSFVSIATSASHYVGVPTHLCVDVVVFGMVSD